MASNLPNDILETIMLKLPVKSLLRFKTVSRLWNAMISDPGFVRIHHQQQSMKNSDSQNLFLRETDDGFQLVRLESPKFQTEAVMECPDDWWKYVVCFGDGVALLTGMGPQEESTFLLWNPCTRQEKEIPFPFGLDHDPIIYGLCYDPCNDDLKVVIHFEDLYTVFSSKNTCWTEKRRHFFYFGAYDSGLAADGALYWVWFQEHETYWSYKILYFDPRDDNFKILKKPENVKDDQNVRLICLKGCLCLYYGSDETTFEIWIKEKGGPDRNSWEVLMKIENLPRPSPRSFRLLTYFVENKILIDDTQDDRFLIYNPSEKSYEEFEDKEFNRRFLFPCIDSLFLPVIKTRP